MSLIDCYKILINTIFDFEKFTQFGPEYLLYGLLDVCSNSDDEDVSIYDKDLISSSKEWYWLGGYDYTESGNCVKILYFW